MGKYAIRVENLGKQYTIDQYQGRYKSLRDTLSMTFTAPFKRLMRGKSGQDSQDSTIWALKDVNFEIQPGEVVGIIGRNGAGKSTLLKILARITEPTTGEVHMRGRVGSLLEVGTGFHQELTGRENIFLNGAILGMSRKEIQNKFDEIVDFAEIEKFIDTPAKHYSSGMYMRLAFAVAAHLEPEILLVDEVLAVGDAQFQKKCLGKMGEVAREGRTVLFVSHNMGAIRGLCRKGICLEKGIIFSTGDIERVINSYLDSRSTIQEPVVKILDNPQTPIQLTSVSVRNQNHNIATSVSTNEPFYLEIDFTIRRELSNSYVAVHVHDNNLNTLLFIRDFEQDENLLIRRLPGKYRYRLHIPAPLMVPGIYRVSVHAVIIGEGKKSSVDYACPFEVFDSGSERARKGFDWIGKVNPPLKLDVLRINLTDQEEDLPYPSIE